MDNTKITHISLCTGYGGIDLGLRRVLPGLRTVAYSEIEAFAIENLLARMEEGQLDAAPIWSDLKTFPWACFSGLVDILSGGYPCQPFSAAGKRAGTDDPRHIWPYIAEGIRVLKPTLCLFENVEGHITLGLSTVISDLEEMGYRATWGIFSASECLDASGRTAPHQRKRVFIMAHHNDAGLEGLRKCGASQGWEAQTGHAGGRCDLWPSRPGEPQYTWEPPRVVANSENNRHTGGAWMRNDREQPLSPEQTLGTREACWTSKPCGRGEGLGNTESGAQLGRASGDEGHAAQPDKSVGDTSNARRQGGREANDPGWQVQRLTEPDGSGSNGEMELGQRQTQPSLGRDTDGPASGLDYAELCVTCDNRTDELRLLGNGVVPATAALAFKTLLQDILHNERKTHLSHTASH